MRRYWVIGPAGNVINNKALMNIKECEEAACKARKGDLGLTTRYAVVSEEIRYRQSSEIVVQKDGRGAVEPLPETDERTQWADSIKPFAPFQSSGAMLSTFPPEIQEEVNRELVGASQRAQLRAKVYKEAADEAEGIFNDLRASCERLRAWLEKHQGLAKQVKARCEELTAERKDLERDLRMMKGATV